jgi:hypothetical protein
MTAPSIDFRRTKVVKPEQITTGFDAARNYNVTTGTLTIDAPIRAAGDITITAEEDVLLTLVSSRP